MRCKYNLYERCVIDNPSIEECRLCIKVYRIKHGLKTVIEVRGDRGVITL